MTKTLEKIKMSTFKIMEKCSRCSVVPGDYINTHSIQTGDHPSETGDWSPSLSSFPPSMSPIHVVIQILHLLKWDVEPLNTLPPYKNRAPSCLDSAHRLLHAPACSSLPSIPCFNEGSCAPHHTQEHETPSCDASGWTGWHMTCGTHHIHALCPPCRPAHCCLNIFLEDKDLWHLLQGYPVPLCTSMCHLILCAVLNTWWHTGHFVSSLPTEGRL